MRYVKEVAGTEGAQTEQIRSLHSSLQRRKTTKHVRRDAMLRISDTGAICSFMIWSSLVLLKLSLPRQSSVAIAVCLLVSAHVSQQ